jgi:glucose-6-phosphate dehydrogenase assembly protein OpcA
MTAEEERTRLIGDIARVLRDGPVPEEARAAALTLIGWLARRMPGEPVSHCDVGRCKGYSGPPSGPKPCGPYADGSDYQIPDNRPQSAR